MRGGEHARRRGEGSIEGGGIEGAQRGSDILSPRIASGLEPLTPAAGCAPSLHPHRPCTLQTPKWPPPPQGCLQVLINGEWTKNLSIKVAVLGEAAAAGGGGASALPTYPRDYCWLAAPCKDGLDPRASTQRGHSSCQNVSDSSQIPVIERIRSLCWPASRPLFLPVPQPPNRCHTDKSSNCYRYRNPPYG